MSDNDKNSFADFMEFMQMAPEERKEHMTDLLADVAEVWMDDDANSICVRGMISSMRAFLDSVNELAEKMNSGGKAPNAHVGGLFMHAYGRMARDYLTLTGLTDVKRSLKG